MTQVQDFLNNPLIAPIYGLLVIKVVDLLLAIYRSIQQSTFDWKKLPGILDATVVQQVLPLGLLGVSSFFVTEPLAQAGLVAAYVSLSATAIAAAAAALVQKVRGSYTATTLDQDRLLPLTTAGATPPVTPVA